MKTAAVAELKASLSKYLARVKAGEEVLVTDRGRPIAKIIPLEEGDVDMDVHVRELERTGRARIGRRKLPTDFWDRPRPKDPKGAVLQALLDEREDAL